MQRMKKKSDLKEMNTGKMNSMQKKQKQKTKIL